MGKTVYYDKLIEAGRKKGKSELEVYQCVDNCVNDILEKELAQNKRTALKALLAYFEGETANERYIARMQISYALLIASGSILASVDSENVYVKLQVALQVAILFLVVSMLIALIANYNHDFPKRMVICVLNDKLEEYTTEPEVGVNVTTIMVEDKKKKPKGKKKHKKKK